ncbi:MAG TPA: ATPase [Bacteroidetes bacterium]|nr:ATPase [Bacteroidota bacterium]
MGTIKQEHFIKAPAEDIYNALVNPFAIELWSGYPARMSEEAGSEFEIWDGDIAGRNLNFEKNRMIRQEWYFGEQEESSVVTIRLYEEKKGTRIKLEHTHVPDSEMEEMENGWKRYYFGALKHYFEE